MQTSPRAGSRRKALALTLLASAVVTLGLAACGVAPPATPPPPPGPPPFAGISVEAPNHTIGVRDIFVPDAGEAGYKAGGKAPLSLQLWNNTTFEINLVGATLEGKPLELIGGQEASSTTYKVSIPGGGNIQLSQGVGRYLQVACLPADVPTGSVLPVKFEFDNKLTMTVSVPVGKFPPTPGSPLPTANAKPC